MKALHVWRVRGWMPNLVYGGWHAACRRCGWSAWARDQSHGFDLAHDHYCRQPEFEPDLDLLYRQGREMGMW